MPRLPTGAGRELVTYDRSVAQEIEEARRLRTFTVAGLPDAATYQDYLIVVTDETGGRVPAFSDGTNWRRVTDRAIVS